MADNLPIELQLFSMHELEQILHCMQTKREELIAAGEIKVIRVAGKKLATAQSALDYLCRCEENPKPTGRSAAAQRASAAGLVKAHEAKRRINAAKAKAREAAAPPCP